MALELLPIDWYNYLFFLNPHFSPCLAFWIMLALLDSWLILYVPSSEIWRLLTFNLEKMCSKHKDLLKFSEVVGKARIEIISIFATYSVKLVVIFVPYVHYGPYQQMETLKDNNYHIVKKNIPVKTPLVELKLFVIHFNLYPHSTPAKALSTSSKPWFNPCL